MRGNRRYPGALVLAAVALAVGVLPANSEPSPSTEALPVVVIEGRGHGHGVGMAQDGARWMGVAGASTADILGHFYPGTTVTRSAGTTVRVDVFTTKGPSAVVSFPAGGEVRDTLGGDVSPGFPISVQPGGSVRLSFEGAKYHAFPLDRAVVPAVKTPPPPPTPAPTTVPPEPTTTVAPDLLDALLAPIVPPPPPPPAPAAAPAPATPSEPTSARSLWAVPRGDTAVGIGEQGRLYRGRLQATAGGGGLQMVNHVDIESYLRGMGEVVEPSWPAAALRTQAIAARTYALWSTAGGGNLCSTERCQVYLGQSAEYSAMDRAVADTRGQVLRYKGALVEAVYSASGGGVSATAVEGFGPGSNEHPYFAAKPYTTQDPQPWVVTMALPELGRRLGYRGTVTGAGVSQAGPSGRALAVTLEGDAEPLTVGGPDLAYDLSLRSTLFTIRVDRPAEAVAEAAPGDTDADADPGPATASALASTGLKPPTAGELGRAPWVALAALMMAAWASAAQRVTAKAGRPAAATGSVTRLKDGPNASGFAVAVDVGVAGLEAEAAVETVGGLP